MQIVDSDVLVSISLENITSNFAPLKSRSMNKVAILTAGASIGSVVVPTRHSSEVAWLNERVHVGHSLLGGELLQLSLLHSSLLINFFVLCDGFIR